MNEKHYFKLGVGNQITDSVIFATKGYVEHIGPVPSDILGGHYRYIRGEIVLDHELKDSIENRIIAKLEQERNQLKQAITNSK